MPRQPQPSPFAARHARWTELHARFGPARAYPYAWRLPELARGEGRLASVRAALALSLTLYGLGRFPEALRNLSPDLFLEEDDAELAAAVDDLRRRCLWWMGEDIAPPPDVSPPGCPPAPAALLRRAYFHFLSDRPLPPEDTAWQAALAADDFHGAWLTLLVYWSRLRVGQPASATDAHAALAALRRQAPAEAAHAAAVYAEAAFHLAPALSLVWLEEALEQGERFGQHHLKVRLLHLKARALEAGGALREADRFLALAREWAARQGAWRVLRDMAL
ncbi:MAG: hypothetical protein FD187_459 [bacterium]|nr:MAG: hypothetical protein FD142_381 [bacterium]KAF0150224.1 MAG: hypothetical protein FD187_459 [bacterium]KAF0169704.1 MAG: hypothetical protein FD158_91 [bacterium]TXT21613.1 MAG: hypothetical protein FD132_512 [bacterium]